MSERDITGDAAEPAVPLSEFFPGVEIVGGSPDDTEVAALVAVGMAARLSAVPPAPPPPTPEWVRRARAGTGAAADQRIPGTRSNQWRWSLHP